MISSIVKQRANIIIVGASLLIVLIAAITLIGRKMTTIAEKMNNTVLEERFLYHYGILSSEFSKTFQTSQLVAKQVINEEQRESNVDFSLVANFAFTLDPKISRVWFDRQDKSAELCEQYNRRDQPNSSYSLMGGELNLIRNQLTKKDHTTNIFSQDSAAPLLNISQKIATSQGEIIVGIDILLMDLFEYFALQKVRISSYATIYSPDGVILFHPDSTLINVRSTDNKELNAIHSVITTKEVIKSTSISKYIELPVIRRYYPIEFADEQLVVALSLPTISFADDINEMKNFTMITIIVSVLIFAIFVFFSLRHWQKEYLKRIKAEEESALMQMQQIMEQINPHFLFNSLNSLYSLINREPSIAREFVLKLSNVYRYVLEKRREILSTVGDEVDFIRQYMFMQKTRFDEQIDVNILIDSELYNHCIPSLGLQTLVENAIKHNSFTPENPLFIKIHAKDGKLIVENNYSPRKLDDKDSMHIGLQRLESIYKHYGISDLVVYQDNEVFRVELPLISHKD